MDKCLICNSICEPYDVVDFNKSCEEVRGQFLPLALIPIYYYLCPNCNFCFAPTFQNWTFSDFEEKIYNDEYIKVDPEYLSIRPTQNANMLINYFKGKIDEIKHLDYGSGNKLMSKILNKNGWNSLSYDPFVDFNVNIKSLGKFDIITAFEVFEHVANIDELMKNLKSLLKENGIILFSTALNDISIQKNGRLTWWYASPRNGHISLFSSKSLEILSKKYGFKYNRHNDLFLNIFYESKENFKYLFSQSENYNFSFKLNKFFLFINEIFINDRKIILYGAGIVSRILTSMFPNNVILVVDRDASKHNEKINGFVINSIESINTIEYDFIFITVLGREKIIKNSLQSYPKLEIVQFHDEEIDNYVFAKEINSFYNYCETLCLAYDNIVLYGAGLVAKIITSLFPSQIKILLDIKTEDKILNFKKIIHPENFDEKQYDALLITVLGREKLIEDYIKNNLNIKDLKIYSFDINSNLDINDSERYLKSLIWQKKIGRKFKPLPYSFTFTENIIHLIFFMGMGDYLFVTPLLKYIKENNPRVKLIAHVSKNTDVNNSALVYDMLERDVNIDKVMRFNGFASFSWEEYDFSDAFKNIPLEDDIILPVLFKHSSNISTHRVLEVFKSFSINVDHLTNIPKPLLYINNEDYQKTKTLVKLIDGFNKKVVFLHLEARSSAYNYKEYNELIVKLIEKNFFVIFISENKVFNTYNTNDFFYLNIKNYEIYESIAFLDAIKSEKYMIAINSVMLHVSSSLDIPTLGLFIFKDSTQTRQTFYDNIFVLTIDKECYDFLPKGKVKLIDENLIKLNLSGLVEYSPKIIVEEFILNIIN